MAHTIGIIGGADGPTAIFVTGNPLPAILAFAALAGAIILIVRFFRKQK
jgi:Na+-transporting methylmalonyl-CoA/oxaloacetate decarboxylase beta subunit